MVLAKEEGRVYINILITNIFFRDLLKLALNEWKLDLWQKTYRKLSSILISQVAL